LIKFYFDNLLSQRVRLFQRFDAVFKDATRYSFDVGYKAKFETTGTDAVTLNC
jgi:hypothetical protein